MPRSHVAAVTVIAVAFSAYVGSLTAQAPTFRSGIDVVRIDAVVVDAKGMPIRGLKAEDFTVVEDGKARPIVAFDAVDLPVDRTAEPGEAAWVRSAPPDVVTNKVEDRRLFMIIIDDAVMRPDPRAIARAKAIARDVVSRLTPDDQAAVVFTQRSGKAQPFTANRARLLAAIDSTGFGKGSGGPAFGEEERDVASVVTLAQAAELLIAAPQPRKTLVLISAGAEFAPETMVPVLSSVKGQNPMSANETATRILGELNRLIEAAARAHVAVYAFDVNDFTNVDVLSAGRNYLRMVAANTGGRATIANEDPVQGVTQMLRESSIYYLIGFTSASATPGRHRVEVRTSYPGARVLSRDSFIVARPAKPAPVPVSPVPPLGSLLPVDQLPMRATATALPGPTSKEAIVAITLGINQPADRLDGAPERLTVQVAAYETTGKFSGGTQLNVQLSPRPNASGRSQYDLLAKLPLKPGRYQLRLAATVPRAKVSGSVFVDLDVPDFSRDGIRVAPLVLWTVPTPPAAPAGAFTGLLPVVPTSHRIFGATDRVSVLARIVRGGKTPPATIAVEATVVDTRNRRVFGHAGSLAFDSGPDRRFIDYTLEVPMETLAVGDYLLTIKATTPNGADERTLRFSRR